MSSVVPIHAVVLAGGESRRLFPFNKVLSDLTGTGRTLLQQALDRSTKVLSKGIHQRLIDPDRFFLLTSRDAVAAMRVQLKLPEDRFFVDPARRGTWPAILWAMAHLRRENPEAILAVMTADHLIPDVPAFRASVSQALSLAQRYAAIAMVGVAPSRTPEDWLGFGAFQVAAPEEDLEGTPVLRFEEKPTAERAATMIAEHGWLWNAGMFFFRIAVAEKALRLYQPGMAETYERLVSAIAAGNAKEAVQAYEKFPAKVAHPLYPSRHVDNTIDYALMAPLVAQSKEDLQAWVAASPLVSWADVGEWTTLRRLVKPDARENIVVGKVTLGRDVNNSILAADAGHVVEVHGVEDMIVAFSNAKALVIPVSQAPQIKDLVSNQKGPVVSAGTDRLEIRMAGSKLTVRPKS